MVTTWATSPMQVKRIVVSDSWIMGFIDGHADKLAGAECYIHNGAFQWADIKGFRLGCLRINESRLYFDANCDMMATLADTLFICNPDVKGRWVRTTL